MDNLTGMTPEDFYKSMKGPEKQKTNWLFLGLAFVAVSGVSVWLTTAYWKSKDKLKFKKPE